MITLTMALYIISAYTSCGAVQLCRRMLWRKPKATFPVPCRRLWTMAEQKLESEPFHLLIREGCIELQPREHADEHWINFLVRTEKIASPYLITGLL